MMQMGPGKPFKKKKAAFSLPKAQPAPMPMEMAPKFGGKNQGGKLKRGHKKPKNMFPPGRQASGRGGF